MPQVRGTQTAINLVEESTYNTIPGTPSAIIQRVKSCSLSASRSLIGSETLTGSRNKAKPVQGNIDGGGNMPQELCPLSMGTQLKHLLGAVTSSGAGPYTHQIDIGALPVGFDIEKDFGANLAGGSRYERFTGCRMASGAFDFPQEGFPTLDVSIKAADSSYSDTPLDATPTDLGHDPFNSFEASITEGGSASAIITKLNFSVSNGLDEAGYVIGSNKRASLAEGFSEIKGSLTALFESEALLNKAVNGTESSIVITLSRGDSLGSAGNESMVFNLQHLMYERTSAAIEGPAGILLPLNFTIFESGADNGLQVMLYNAVANI